MECPRAVATAAGVQPIRLEIHEEHTHHYADSILAHHPWLREDTAAAMDSVRTAEFAMTAGGRFGISTSGSQGLNLNLRKGFVARSGWRSEVGWTDTLGLAVWLFDPANPFRTGAPARERFDLAHIDEHHNAKRLWNLVADWPRLSSTQQASLTALAPTRIRAHWNGGCSCVLDAVWDEFSENAVPEPVATGAWVTGSFDALVKYPGILPKANLDAPAPTVLGEIQFGNWALAYRDVGRILAVRQKFSDAPVTLFVIIVATGCLAEFISKGTVNFAQSRRALERVGQDLPVPTWLVGIDFVHGGQSEHPDLEPTGAA